MTPVQTTTRSLVLTFNTHSSFHLFILIRRPRLTISFDPLVDETLVNAYPTYYTVCRASCLCHWIDRTHSFQTVLDGEQFESQSY